MTKSYRQGRLGVEIQKIVGNMLLRELKDPRLETAMVSIAAVEVTRDGGIATVYLLIMPYSQDDSADKIEADILDVMNKSKGAIKREISKKSKLRHIPELLFKIDKSLEYGTRMDDLIDKAMKGTNEDEN